MHIIIMIIISVIIGIMDFNGLALDRYTSMIMDSDVVIFDGEVEYVEKDYSSSRTQSNDSEKNKGSSVDDNIDIDEFF